MAGQETYARLEYDLEYHIGLESAPWDADLSSATWLAVGETNRNKFVSAFANAHSRGTFQFAKKGIGPIRHAIRGAGKQFPIVGQIDSGMRGALSILGPFGHAYPLPNTVEAPDDVTGIGGNMLRLVRIDGQNGGSVLNLQNAGTTIGFGVEVRGRWYGFDPSGEGPDGPGSIPNPPGTKTPYGITIEGRNQPSTGRHILFGCVISECGVGIAALGTPTVNHADNVSIYDPLFWNCGTAIKLDNPQAVGWSIHNAEIYNVGGAGLIDPCIVADVVRGGELTFSGKTAINAARAVILKDRIANYSPNYGPTVIQNFKWDMDVPQATSYLTLYHASGPITNGTDYSFVHNYVMMTGGLSNSETPVWDTSRLIVIDDAQASIPINRNDLLFNVSRLPLDSFESAGFPWQRPAAT